MKSDEGIALWSVFSAVYIYFCDNNVLVIMLFAHSDLLYSIFFTSDFKSWKHLVSLAEIWWLLYVFIIYLFLSYKFSHFKFIDIYTER